MNQKRKKFVLFEK